MIGTLHAATVEALLPSVALALSNLVGRTELLTWLKGVSPYIPTGEVRVCQNMS